MEHFDAIVVGAGTMGVAATLAPDSGERLFERTGVLLIKPPGGAIVEMTIA